MFDVKRVRQDFPVLQRHVYGKPLVYLDNAATSQKPSSVIQALVDYYEGYNANVHRGVHALSMEATDRYEEARAKVARFIGAPEPETIIWTRNTTEGLNLIANTWAVDNIGPGDEIVVTRMEHHSNLVPWQKLVQERGAVLRFLPLAEDGGLDLEDVDTIINPRTKLLSVVHMSNSIGTITPVKELAAKARAVGAAVAVDGAQSVPHMPVDVTDLDCDFLAFSGHKMLGPTGIGALYVKRDVLERMEPFLRGGEMVLEVTYESASWNDLPMRFEAGTPNIADSIALGAAVDYLDALGHGKRARARAADDAVRSRRLQGTGRGGRVRPGRRRPPRRHNPVPPPGGAPPRSGHRPRPAGHRHTHGPPLHHAADGRARRHGHKPRELLRVQLRGRDRPAGGRRKGGAEVLHAWPWMSWTSSTATPYSPTFAARATTPSCRTPT